MNRIKADICVIGAGSGGLSVAAGAAQLGLRTVLIEGAEMGGDCLNRGCVPSKALLAAGARGEDWQTAHQAVRDAIASIAPHDSQERFEGLGVTVIRDWARFTGPKTVVAGDTEVRARRFVIATGARPRVPALAGLSDLPYLTSDTIFDLAERPKHLLILGAGPIGLEMAQAHRGLGCAVTVVDVAAPLGAADPTHAAALVDALAAQGIRIIAPHRPVAARATADGVEILLDDGEALQGSHLLVAAGRVAALDDLGLGAAGVTLDPRGVPLLGPDLRARGNGRVFVIGDAAGQGHFTHVAGYHAGIVVRRAVFGLPAKLRHDHIPRCVYTSPEIAAIGLTEAEARTRHGAALTVIRLPMSANDRAVAEGRTGGEILLLAVKGRAVGVSIIGPQAGELIGFWALVMAKNLPLTAVSGVVLPYPTRSEINKRAASTYLSPKLFGNRWLRGLAALVQRLVP